MKIGKLVLWTLLNCVPLLVALAAFLWERHKLKLERRERARTWLNLLR